MGKRFYPLTRAQPKEMLPILDKPVIHYVVEEAVKSGLDEILIVVGYGKDAIINYFDKHPLDNEMDSYGIGELPDIYFVRQKEQKGLGDALRYAKTFVADDIFSVLLGDTIYVSNSQETVTRKFLQMSSKMNASSVAVEEVPDRRLSQYGIIDFDAVDDDLYIIRDIVEKPDKGSAPSNMGITGIYVLEPFIFDYLERIQPGKGGEYQLTDALKLMARDIDVFASRINGIRYDIGSKELWYSTFVEFVRKYSK